MTHGSRDYRHNLALAQLTDLLTQQLATNANLNHGKYPEYNSVITRKQKIISLEKSQLPLVEYACLEFANLSLAESIVEFARRSHQLGYQQVMLLPLFLLPGIHVTVDIPIQIDLAQQILRGQINLKLGSYLGSYSKMVEFLRNKFNSIEPKINQGKILLAHGSRHGGNQPCEVLAKQLRATPAYWSTAPNLAESVEKLVEQGKQNLVILPYFLFTGKITDAIALEVQQLQPIYPHINFRLAQPLGATKELANLIWEGALQ